MKKFFVCALVATLVALAAVPLCLAEEGDLTASVLNRNEKVLYHVFNEPNDIEYADGKLFIGDSDKYEVYDGVSVSSSDLSADSIAYLGGGFATLKDNKLSYGNKVVEGEFSLISGYDDTLYASFGKKISKFSLTDGELILAQTIETDYDVRMIAATDTGCMYTVSRTGYTLVYIDETELVRLDDTVLDIAYLSGKYYILTSSDILMYTEFYLPPVTQPALRGAVAICAGDGVYLLCKTGTVVRYSVDLSSNAPLIASSGEIDWFYTTPVNVDTKLGSIFVTDKSLGTSSGYGRVAMISGEKIEYLSELVAPTAATADNSGKLYVAYSGNKIAVFRDGTQVDEFAAPITSPDFITDIEVDYDGNLYCLTNRHDVINSTGTVLRQNVNAMKFQSTMHYMTDEYIDDIPVKATDFAVDATGNIFAVKGNVVTAIVDGKTSEYTIENAVNLKSIAISKVETSYISYGDLIMVDEANMCVLTIDGSKVGSANVKHLYSPPQLSGEPNSQRTGLVGTTKGSILFTLPIEGEIAYEAKPGENIILLREGSAPDPFVYCAVDTTDGDGKTKLVTGYAYKSTIDILDYHAPKFTEAKINANNTPVYKYPSINSPVLSEYSFNTLITILPFAANYPEQIEADSLYSDVWYTDAYGNKWYRIAYGKNEGFIIAAQADTNIFSNEIEMPQPNATITGNASLYRYDEESDSYVELTGLGTLEKDTRVRVEVPYGASNDYTKVIFYREGLGVINADCYVETKYIEFDGVDLVKIIAICVVVLAVIVLIIVIIRRIRLRRLNRSRAPEYDNRS